jgi:hypothetical protein
MFIDRTYSYLVPYFLTKPVRSRLKPAKRLVFIQTQGQPDPALFNDIYPKYDYFMTMMGFTDNLLIRACGVRDAGDVLKSKDIMAQADEAARSMVGPN